MDNGNNIYNQCRFCLKLVEQMNSFSIFDEFENVHLYEFVQELLSIEFTAENSLVCEDCFSMWRMIQDYLLCCTKAHQIVLSTNGLVFRKPWLENDEEKKMLIGVCRAVKKLYHELDTLKPHSKRKSKGQTHKKRKVSLSNSKERETKPIHKNTNIIKEEDPVEIDDSAAFLSDKPIKETKTLFSKAEKSESIDDQNNTSILDDCISIVEPQIDHVDLIDSSSEEDVELAAESAENSNQLQRTSKVYDEEIMKTVCQLCGVRTRNMADHLEQHIQETENNMESEYQETDSDCSNSSSSRISNRSVKLSERRTNLVDSNNSSKANQVEPMHASSSSSKDAMDPLKCNVCGVKFVSMLTARLHARLHPTKAQHNPGKLKRSVKKVTR